MHNLGGIADTGYINVLLYFSGSGCHYLHLYKGMCATDKLLHQCRVYKARLTVTISNFKLFLYCKSGKFL